MPSRIQSFSRPPLIRRCSRSVADIIIRSDIARLHDRFPKSASNFLAVLTLILLFGDDMSSDIVAIALILSPSGTNISQPQKV
jgi:hypothetical protein